MKHKRIILSVVFVCFFIAIFSIGIGLYLNYLAQPKHVFEKMFSSMGEKFDPYFSTFDSLFIGDQFSVHTDVKFELDSPYYSEQSLIDVEALKKYHFLKNLSKMDMDISLLEDSKKKKAFGQLLGVIGEEKIIDTRFGVDNATFYYFVDGVSDHYINNGTCNYFENINQETTSMDNLIYLKSFILKSFDNSLKEEYFTKYEAKQDIGGTKKDSYVISIRFTNKRIIMILNSILQDLKKDERAKVILTNIYPDFATVKIKDDTPFLQQKESYTLNIYTSKVLHKPYKYELVYLNQDDSKSILYELGNESDTILYLENNHMIYSMAATNSEDSFLLKISDSKNDSVGELRIDLQDKDRMIHFSFDDQSKRCNVEYSSKYTNYKKNKEYHNEKVLSLDYVDNGNSYLDGTVTILTDVSLDTKMEEDFSSAILSSKLTETEKEVLKTKKDTIKKRLER